MFIAAVDIDTEGSECIKIILEYCFVPSLRSAE